MKLCILCEDDKLDIVKDRAKILFRNENILKIGVSENGIAPITHWFCELDVSERAYDRIMTMQKYTIMENIGKDEFLKKHNLQIVD